METQSRQGVRHGGRGSRWIVGLAMLAALGASLGAQTRVLDIQPGAKSSNPTFLTDMDGILFFRADDGVSGAELWRSDGTTAGTFMVKDINPGPAQSYASALTPMNGMLFLSASDGVLGSELWRSDGTPAGTVMVRDIEPGSFTSQIPNYMLVLDNVLYFRGWPQVLGGEPWRSDGTTAGTYMIKDVNQGSGTSMLGAMAIACGALWLPCTDGIHGYELWRSYGTAASTVMIKDINPGSAGSQARDFKEFKGQVVFVADDGATGFELWKTDGTEQGTVMIKDINPGASRSWPQQLTEMGGYLYFSAEDATTGRELWKSDGTAAGTVLVRDINPGTAASGPSGLVAADGYLYFSADDGVNGRELWLSDGTAAGTVMVADINKGGGSGLMQYSRIFATGSSHPVVFDADDGVSGRELWITDGTQAGTLLLADINPGSGSSNPFNYALSGSNLFFSAEDGSTGVELWMVPLATLKGSWVTRFGQPCQGTAGLRPRIGNLNLPRIGSTNFAISLSGYDLYTARPYLFLGNKRQPKPVGLGCYALVPDPLMIVRRSGSTARVNLPIPNDPILIGAELFAQWIIPDEGGLFGLVALSDGLHAIVGL